MSKPKIYYRDGDWIVKGPTGSDIVWIYSDTWQQAWKEYQDILCNALTL